MTYTLGSRVTMPSRSDQQLIQIASREMPADFFKLAIPVLTSQVYEEAAIINEGGQVLLAGPVSAYLAGKFVGHCDIPTVSVGETFTVGFGIDSSLRATRELVNRKERPQGGNRVVDFTYRLTIENFSGEPAEVRLLDRLPQASESQIRLTLADPGQPLSEDAAYQKNERKNGILRWDVEVPGRAAAADAWSLEYNFTLEYDRNMMISGMAVTQR